MYTNGSYALVQLVMGQVVMTITVRRLVVVAMAQGKNDIELKKKIISTCNSVWESATFTRWRSLVQTQVGAKQIEALSKKGWLQQLIDDNSNGETHQPVKQKWEELSWYWTTQIYNTCLGKR